MKTKPKTKKAVRRKNHNHYDSFVRQARSVGFTDDELDFLWDWFCIALLDKRVFLHKDNYSRPIKRK